MNEEMNYLINQSIHSLHRRDLSVNNTASKEIYRYLPIYIGNIAIHIRLFEYYLKTQARWLSDGTDSSPGSRVYTDKFTDI